MNACNHSAYAAAGNFFQGSNPACLLIGYRVIYPKLELEFKELLDGLHLIVALLGIGCW